MFFLAYPQLIPSKGGAVEGPGSASGTGSGVGLNAGTSLGAGTAGNMALGGGGTVIAERRRRKEDDAMDGGLTANIGTADDMSTTTAALKAERYRPRIFGFQVHEVAKLQRWQEAVRDQ